MKCFILVSTHLIENVEISFIFHLTNHSRLNYKQKKRETDLTNEL